MGDFTPLQDVVQPAEGSAGGFTPVQDVVAGQQTTNPTPPGDPNTSFLGRQGQEMNAQFYNTRLAGMQGVASSVHEHKKNFLGDAYENDKGEIEYKDKEGKQQVTDRTKHVIMIDPLDMKHKVYGRSEDTDESGPLNSRAMMLGNLFNEAFVTNPTMGSVRASPVGAAAARQGIEVPSGAISNPGLSKLTTAVPLAGGPLREAAHTSLAQTTGRIGELGAEASATGEAVTAAEAGATARSGIKEWMGPTSRDNINKAYDLVDKHIIHPDATAELTKTMGVASKIEALRSSAGVASSEAVKKIEGAITKPGGLNYEEVKFLRQYVGEMIETGNLPADISGKELKQLYGSLSDDMRTIIRKAGLNWRTHDVFGDKALSVWERANKYSKLVNDRRRSLETILGNEAKSDESVLGSVHRMVGSSNTANIKRLSEVKKTLDPDAWKDVTSGVLGRLGVTNTTEGRVFDAGKWGKDYAALSPEGKDVLFGSKTPLRGNLEDIATVLTKNDTLKSIAKGGGFTHGVGAATGLTLELFNIWHHGITAMEVFHAAGAALGVNALARVLSNPVGTRSMLNFLKGVPSGAQQVSNFVEGQKESPTTGSMISGKPKKDKENKI